MLCTGEAEVGLCELRASKVEKAEPGLTQGHMGRQLSDEKEEFYRGLRGQV